MYRDYRDKVNFYYVYKSLAHPEVNGYVSAFNLKERLQHIQHAKRMLHTEIPWICDTMADKFSNSLGGAPNGEFVFSTEGELVRKRFWSNPETLRSDLEELVGKSETTTTVADLENYFEPKPNPIASGVVPRIELPKGLSGLTVKPIVVADDPFFCQATC